MAVLAVAEAAGAAVHAASDAHLQIALLFRQIIHLLAKDS